MKNEIKIENYISQLPEQFQDQIDQIFWDGIQTLESITADDHPDDEHNTKVYVLSTFNQLLALVEQYANHDYFETFSTDEYTAIRKLTDLLPCEIELISEYETQQEKREELLKDFNVYSFILPEWCIPAIANEDESHMSDDESESFELFQKNQIEKLENWEHGHWSFEERNEYWYTNDVDGLAGSVCECEYIISKVVEFIGPEQPQTFRTGQFNNERTK